MQDLLIVGGGYAGLWAAMAAAGRAREAAGELHIRLLSKDAYLTHRPRLYESDPRGKRTPLAQVLEPIGVELLVGEVDAVDLAQRRVGVAGGGNGGGHAYDRLLLAAGSVLHRPAIEPAGGRTWNIDQYDAAVALDDHLGQLMADDGDIGIVVVGAGFTGIELATEMRARLAHHGGADRAARARLALVDRAAAVGEDIGPSLRPHIMAALRAAGVDLHLNDQVRRVEAARAVLASGATIPSRTVIVTAGARASGLAGLMPVELDELGRLPVDPMLRVDGVDGVYAAGDLARAFVDEEHIALMSCQHAMVMGKYAGHNAAGDLLGLPLVPYRQDRYVTCLDLGSWGAVFSDGWSREVQAIKQDAKQRKQVTMTQRIYPPSGDAAAILEAARL
ncbi:MAG: FAD-dependent oxidoreductase [Alphaproteobacteria bacterium]|jgi:NADH dehydrogenase|nr:FAD-dependent oxidoreductase [Alphaproteobacteria bacterium]MDP6564598.1 FAD-dependent oxidoreductase [Alphaproteobacteria bacterium]MDP6814531.1 FAD-dependent oxidoreductase [Alphaproteobacteria bacterium]